MWRCRPETGPAEHAAPNPRSTQIPEGLTMANTKSAKKAVRKIEQRTEVNKARRSRMRTHIRKVEEAIAKGDKGAAAEALRGAQPEIMRAVTKGVIKQATASRKISRLSAQVKKIEA